MNFSSIIFDAGFYNNVQQPHQLSAIIRLSATVMKQANQPRINKQRYFPIYILTHKFTLCLHSLVILSYHTGHFADFVQLLTVAHLFASRFCSPQNWLPYAFINEIRHKVRSSLGPSQWSASTIKPVVKNLVNNPVSNTFHSQAQECSQLSRFNICTVISVTVKHFPLL